MYYRNASSETAVEHVKTLFEGLSVVDKVYAEYEVDEEYMISLHNHMNSGSTWLSISGWDSSVGYTIRHPEGDITVSDKNRGEDTSIFRDIDVIEIQGMRSDATGRFSIFKKRRDLLDVSGTPCHYSSAYTWVKIESTKVFKYASERASWDFSLSVSWEGKSKEEAESSDKKYFVKISMASIEKASRDPRYTAASFMEKIMDTLFQASRDRHIVMLDL